MAKLIFALAHPTSVSTVWNHIGARQKTLREAERMCAEANRLAQRAEAMSGEALRTIENLGKLRKKLEAQGQRLGLSRDLVNGDAAPR